MPQQLVRISENVLIWPHQPQHTQATVGVIVGRNQTTLIDAGNGAPVADRIRRALAAMAAPPVRQIVYTHHHWDHVFGAYVFDAPVMANERSLPFLLEKRQQPWGPDFLAWRQVQNPLLKEQCLAMARAAGDWSQLRIVLPETTFDRSLTLDAGGVTLQLHHVGGDHSPDAVTVKVVEDGVVFLGDCYYPPPPYEAGPGQDQISYEILKTVYDDACSVYVDGHNPPYSRRQLQRLLHAQRLMNQLRNRHQDS